MLYWVDDTLQSADAKNKHNLLMFSSLSEAWIAGEAVMLPMRGLCNAIPHLIFLDAENLVTWCRFLTDLVTTLCNGNVEFYSRREPAV